ncbi:MAG: hypothetical protein Q9222_004015 [Ikaeria aurantiellina]
MSDASSDISDADPSWGSLAAERYLLNHWDPQSTDSPDQQRKRLVKEFLHAESKVIAPEATPTAAEISTILKPWRTQEQREIVESTSMVPAVWVRTCYTPGSDAKHEAIIQSIELDNAVDGEHRLLNNPDLYNYGSQWQRVFQVLPELLHTEPQSWTYRCDAQRKAVEELRAYAQGGLAQADRRLVDNLTGVSQGTPEIGLRGAELEHSAARALQSAVHQSRVVAWVVLEDAEALDTGKVGLMFVDPQGRVVRSSRLEPGDAEMMGGLWVDGSWDEMDDWEDATFGPEYQAQGEFGGLLLETMRNV